MHHDTFPPLRAFFRSQAALPRRPVGIYVSGASEGCRRRAIAIAKQAPDYFTLLGSGLKGKSDALPIVDLPEESPAKAGGGAGSAEKSRRLSRIAEWIDCAKPALMLIDGSAQIAALARDKNVPTAYMRLAGRHYDAAHLQAFAAAEAVLCPFHPLLESDEIPQWLKNRSRYFPGLTENENFCADTAAHIGGESIALLVAGHDCGGEKHISASPAQLTAAAASLRGRQLWVAGCACPAALQANCPPNLQFFGHVSHLNSLIRQASVVIGAASDCLIAAVAAAGKPFICVPQRRPFDEQAQKAEKLAALRAATVYRRLPRNWEKAVAKALKRGAVIAALHEEKAAARAADLLLGSAYGTAACRAGAGAAAVYISAAEPRAGARRSALLWQKAGGKPARGRRAA